MKFSLKLLKELDACKDGYALGRRLILKAYPNIKEDEQIDYYEGLNGLSAYILQNCPENRHWIEWFRRMEDNPYVIKYYGNEIRNDYFITSDNIEFDNFDEALVHVQNREDPAVDSLTKNLGINGVIKNADGSETWIQLDLSINNNSPLFDHFIVYESETGLNRIAKTYIEAAKMYDDEALKLYKIKQQCSAIYQQIESECGHFYAWDKIYPQENDQ
jgi:hypothetical protein